MPPASYLVVTGAGAGLEAVHDRGGITIVQDPRSAAEPGMPRSALAGVPVDHCLPLEEIAPLRRLVGARPAPRAGFPGKARMQTHNRRSTKDIG